VELSPSYSLVVVVNPSHLRIPRKPPSWSLKTRALSGAWLHMVGRRGYQGGSCVELSPSYPLVVVVNPSHLRIPRKPPLLVLENARTFWSLAAHGW
jgi:hypothetical protein